MRLLPFGLLLLITQFAIGQKRVVDSLYSALEKNPTRDSLRVSTLLQLCWHESTSHPEKHKAMAEEVIEISREINYRKGEASGIRSVGVYYLYNGNYDEAIKYVYDALRLFEKIPDLKGMGSCYQTIGSIHRQRSDFEKSKEFYEKAITVFQNINNEKDLANTYNSLGVLHLSFSKFDEALTYIFKSLEIRKKTNDLFGLSQSYTNVAIIYTNQEKHKEAIEYFEKALPLVLEVNEKQQTAVLYDGLGHLYTLTGDYKKAEASLLKALELAKEIGFKRSIEVAYSKLTFLEETRGRYKEALEYSHAAYHYLDSAYTEESAAQVAEAETRYDTEKKKQTIALLERDNRIQNIKMTIAIASSLLLAISFVIYYFFQRYRQNKNLKILNLQIDYLTQQNNDLSNKTKVIVPLEDDKISDSYQQALLKKAIEVVESNISDPLFGIEKMAEEIGMSRSSLQRKIKTYTGFSPSELIRNIRLRKAATLLKSKSDSISQISFLVGFEDPSYFTKSFKKQFGVPPSEYMQNMN